MERLELDQNIGTAFALPAPVPHETLSPDSHVEPEGQSGVAIPPSAPDAAQVPDYGMPIHPVCELFPLMAEKSKTALVEDIRVNGLIQPIVVHEGQLVDGRNRFDACRLVGIEPRFIEWREIYSGSMTVSRWIWSINAERRHLTADQIVAIHVKLCGFEEIEAARKRQLDAGKQQGQHGKEGGRGRVKPLPTISSEGLSPVPEVEQEAAARPASKAKGDVRKKLALDSNSSEYKVQQAINVEKQDPELLTKVTQGVMPLVAAAKEAKQVKAKTAAMKPPTLPLDKRAPTKAKPFDMERKLKDAMVSVDKVVATLTDGQRDPFLMQLIKTLKAMR
jgi:ParB-like chromosome segregation protein Spo0J